MRVDTFTGYYATIPTDATGDDLKTRLHDLIDEHQPLSYRDLPKTLAVTDADPDIPGNVILL